MREFATYLITLAVIARAIGWNQETAPVLASTWILLGLFGIGIVLQQILPMRRPLHQRGYTLILSGLTVIMLYTDPTLDFLSLLFLPLSFQAVEFFNSRVGFAWIGGFSLALAGRLFFGLEWEAGLTNVLAGSAANFMMGSFAHLIKRTEQRQQENQRLFGDLQSAYRQLKDSAAQAEKLAAATERHRLVRELHDSLTQTLFSMNLAVQSAQLSVDEDPTQVDGYLTRLQALAHTAVSEVQSLTGQVANRPPTQAGLVAAIQKLIDQRQSQDGLKVTFEVIGERTLPELEQANLYRVVQEALNNIIRHAGVRQALVRLCLDKSPGSLEIIDEGCGFDQAAIRREHSFGLDGMAERVSEIGWELEIISRPGMGTQVRVSEKAE
jgi:signal transduction histidine kinase